MNLSNLPPGVADYDIERAAGAYAEYDLCNALRARGVTGWCAYWQQHNGRVLAVRVTDAEDSDRVESELCRIRMDADDMTDDEVAAKIADAIIPVLRQREAAEAELRG